MCFPTQFSFRSTLACPACRARSYISFALFAKAKNPAPARIATRSVSGRGAFGNISLLKEKWVGNTGIISMGLLGFLVTVFLMILGVGYFLFGNSNSISVINDKSHSTLQEGLSRYEEVKNQTLDVKNLVEQKVAEKMQEEEGIKIEEGAKGDKEANKNTTDEIKIINRLMSSGFSVSEKRVIDTVVLHSSYDLAGPDPYSVNGVIKEYEEYGVSAHYLIDRAGTIYRLVEDKNIAYHAGASQMSDGRKNVNNFSISVEMINTLEGQYTESQYKSVNELIAYLKKQYPVKFIVGHKDIAPDRKTDPWNFDWKRLK